MSSSAALNASASTVEIIDESVALTMAMRHWPMTALAAALVSVASSADEQPRDLSIAYRWTNGAASPRYSTEYFIEIRSQGESEISLHMGRQGSDEQKVSEEFFPDPAGLQDLIDYIRKRHSRLIAASARFRSSPSAPGSGLCHLVLVESGTAHPLPCGLGARHGLRQRIRHLVPEAVKQKIDAQHAEFLASVAASQNEAP